MVKPATDQQRLLELGRCPGKLAGRGMGESQLKADPGLRPVIGRCGATREGSYQLCRQRREGAGRPHDLQPAPHGESQPTVGHIPAAAPPPR